MQAILELCNQQGFKLDIEFVLNEKLLIDPQVQRIGGQFSGVKSAILKRANTDEIIREYESSKLMPELLTRNWTLESYKREAKSNERVWELSDEGLVRGKQ